MESLISVVRFGRQLRSASFSTGYVVLAEYDLISSKDSV